MSDLAEACADLRQRMTQARLLLHLHDSGDGSGSSYGRLHEPQGSAAPWNAAVAAVYLDAFFGVRRLEEEWRAARGLKPLARGGSDGNTAGALAQLPAMELAVPRALADDGLRQVTGWITRIRQLRAVDEQPRWVPLRPGPDGVPPACPHCRGLALRVADGRPVVRCFTTGCEDLDGHPPIGLLGFSTLDGTPCLRWHDGLVTYAEN